VNANPTISISVSPNDTVCEGVQLTLTASGGVSHLWSNGVTNGIPFAPSTQGYIVQVLDANGCQSDSSVSILVNALPTVTLSLPFDSVCGFTMPVFPIYPLSGGIPSGGAYNGSDVQGTDLVGDIVAGEHFSVVQYIFTDNHGCSNTAADSVYLYNCETGLSDAFKLCFFVYPNPAATILTIVTKVPTTFELTTPKGDIVETYQIEKETTIDISTLRAGVYFIVNKNNGESFPFVKQ
jgi:hypothetical protein